jgi:hypothetical protein
LHYANLHVWILTMYSWGDPFIEVKWEEECTGLQWRTPKKRGRLKDLGVNSMITLK